MPTWLGQITRKDVSCGFRRPPHRVDCRGTGYLSASVVSLFFGGFAEHKIPLSRAQQMDASAQRRLDCVCGHFLSPAAGDLASGASSLHADLQENVVSGKQWAPIDAYPVIIGGMVLDIHAKPATTALTGTTTPGEILWLSGGVARNVAECMSKFGWKPFIISVIGTDVPGIFLLDCWRSAGLPTEGIRRDPTVRTPVVSNIFDIGGELAVAVASVGAVEDALLPEWIGQFKNILCAASVLMVDANMNTVSLEAACKIAADFGIPVWFEPVSITKSKRVTSLLNLITCASPNQDELFAMANALSSSNKFHSIQRHFNGRQRVPLKSVVRMLEPAINILLETGLKILIVTLGSDGVLLCSKESPDFIKNTIKGTKQNNVKELYQHVSLSCPPKKIVPVQGFGQGNVHPYILHFPALKASVVSLTGAGDCLVGGILAAACCGLDLIQSMAVGIAVAKAAVEVIENVPLEFCLARIADDARQIYSAAELISM